jgi:large repetitive protein
MTRFAQLLRVLGLASSLATLVGCQAIFGEFKVDDNAFSPGGGTQTGPILLAPTKGLYTTEWGGQATFTIVLDREPTANVTVALSSSNTNEGKVTPASVTFTKDDWKAPQVVTVTGVDDTLKDANQGYRIITAPAVSEDSSFNGKNPIDLELTNVDNETAGITVVPRAGLETSEIGGQDTFTVVLNSKPEKDVTIKLTSDTPTEGTVGPESLLFTPLNWMAPQLVTVSGVDDEVKDRAQLYKITVACTGEDQNYARVAPVTVEVTNVDNESAGVTVVLVSGVAPSDPTKLRTSEGGDSATFTVVLNARPIGEVSIPVSSSVPSEGLVSPELLTFTELNWNAPQTVAVMGVEDDGTADGDQPYAIVLGVPTSEDADYAALPETKVPAFNDDNETPGFTLMLLSGIDPKDSNKLLTSEGGTTATFSLALNSRPLDTVVIALSSSQPGEATVTPSSLTFTQDNWQSPHVVSVTGLNDDIEDGSPVFYIRTGTATSTDLSYVLDPADVQVTNQDDDSAGVVVLLAKGIDPNNATRLVTDEYGSTATFTVALTSEPKDDVSIQLASSNTNEGTVFPVSLTFTKLNYRAPQTVTVTGVNDDVVIVDGNQPFSINVGAATSTDPSFNGKFAGQVQVTNRDDDTAGVIVSPTSGLTTSEAGKTATFTVRLQSKPSDVVTVALSSDKPSEGRPNVSSVTFTPVNWSANQTVTVTGQEDDGVADGPQSYKIILAPAQSNDPNYQGKPDPADVSITNDDNDSAKIIVTPTSGLITQENGLSATFTIVLASKPVGTDVTVRVQLSSSDTTEGRVSPATVTFNAVNWKSAQTVTVTGLNDDVADGNQPYMIITSPASSIDPNYFNLNPSDVLVSNVDDDSAGVSIMPIPSATPAQTTEKAGKATFTVALTSLPTSDVTYTVTSLDTSEGRVSPATLRFTPANGKTAQVVTVTGFDDDLADGDQQYVVRLGNGTSADPGYSGQFGTDLPFVNVDDDHAGFLIEAAPALKTTENNAGTATFTVALRSQPLTNVSIGVRSNDTAEGKVSPTTLQFTPSNWATPQTVTITGVQDEVADGDQTYQVELADANSPDDPAYHGKFGTQLDVKNIDDDMAGYTVDAASMLQTTEGGGTATFTVTLTSKPPGTSTVTLGLTSSKPKEGTVAPSSLTFSGADWDQPHLVTVTGIDDQKADGDVAYQISFTADAEYFPTAPTPVALTNLGDGDTAGILVSATTCATTTGTTATFTIQLTSQPTTSVTIPLTSDTPAMGTVAPDAVTFTPTGTSSWDTPQTVTVTGVSDGMYKIITDIAIAPTETTGYSGLMSVADDVSCTNTTLP